MAPSHAAARRTFSRLQTPLDVPNLIDIQRRSFERLTDTKNGTALFGYEAKVLSWVVVR